jgi:hypothetical protein
MQKVDNLAILYNLRWLTKMKGFEIKRLYEMNE